MSLYRHSIALLGVLALLTAVLAGNAGAQEEEGDWHVVERHTTSGPPSKAARESAAPSTAGGGGDLVACGEKARPAEDPYKSIVAQLNEMNGVDFPVYESVAKVSPHASPGNCIFYNEAWLDGIMKRWMRIDDPAAVKPMLYAIFAHEEGHLVHGDVDRDNIGKPTKPRELAADQFAGYTVERLGIRRLDPDELTFYYRVVGDDFMGAHDSHGTGDERTGAFVDGWHRAEVGLPETSGRPAGGMGEP